MSVAALTALQVALSGDEGAPIRTKVLVTVALLNATGRVSTPAAVAEALGLERGPVRSMLSRLKRSMATLSAEHGNYRIDAEGMSIPTPIVSIPTPIVSIPTPKVSIPTPAVGDEADRVDPDTHRVDPDTPRRSASGGEATYKTSPYGEGLSAHPRAREGQALAEPLPAEGLDRGSRAAGFPDFSALTGPPEHGCTSEVIDAWRSIPMRIDGEFRPVAFWFAQVIPIHVRELGQRVKTHGEGVVLKAISMLAEGGGGSKPSHLWKSPPRVDYLDSRIQKIQRNLAITADSAAAIPGLPAWCPAHLVDLFGSVVEAAAYEAQGILNADHPQKDDARRWARERVHEPAVAKLITIFDWQFDGATVERARSVCAD